MSREQTPYNTGYSAQAYPPQYSQQAGQGPVEQPPTIGNYVVMMLIAMIPIGGLIMMIIWAIGGVDVPQWKQNYARAYFIMMAVGFGLTIILIVALGSITYGIIAGLVGSLG